MEGCGVSAGDLEQTHVVELPITTLLDSRRAAVSLAIRRARRLARVDAAEFADLLQARLADESPEADGMTITPESVGGWESGLDVPNAVVLLAAADVAGVEVELLFGRRHALERLRQLERVVARQSQLLQALRQRVGTRWH